MARGKFNRKRRGPLEVAQLGKQSLRTPDEWRGRAAWHMPLEDVLIGSMILGFTYEMSGDDRPTMPRVWSLR